MVVRVKEPGVSISIFPTIDELNRIAVSHASSHLVQAPPSLRLSTELPLV
jgi:hypothetical protein